MEGNCKVIGLPKENKARARMVVFTQGNGEVIVATCKNNRKPNYLGSVTKV
jgi:hypothetical protein